VNFVIQAYSLDYMETTSSTKPEIHNVRILLLPEEDSTMAAKHLVKFRHADFYFIYARGQTDKRTDKETKQTYRHAVTILRSYRAYRGK